MELVLRAYDHAQVTRAESLPVERLWSLLDGAGMRNRSLEGGPLQSTADLWARETVSERMAALMQEGFGRQSLADLWNAQSPQQRRGSWPPIAREEAFALHEDLIRYLTYGLWSAPLAQVAETLATLTHRPEPTFDPGERSEVDQLKSVLDASEHAAQFAALFGASTRLSLSEDRGGALEAAVTARLDAARVLLAPAAALIRAAEAKALRVIAYDTSSANDGLRRFVAAELAIPGETGDSEVDGRSEDPPGPVQGN